MCGTLLSRCVRVKAMRIVLTGAAGFIGSHVARQLVERGHEVAALVRPGTSLARLESLAPRLGLVRGSMEDQDVVRSMLRALQPQVIVHTAWYVHPRDYLHSEHNLESLAATLGLMRQAVAAGCGRFVGVGTCLEYADLPRARREDDPTDPVSLYASCKHAAHMVLRALTQGSAMRWAWARLFHLYGPGEHPERIVPTVTAALHAGRPIDLSPGTQVRDALRVEDVASALVCLAESDAAGVFNVCSGEPRSLRQMLESVGALSERAELLRFGARAAAAGEPAYLVGSPERLKALGWSPAFSGERAFDYLESQRA